MRKGRKPLNVQLPEGLHSFFEEYCKKNGLTMTRAVVEFILRLKNKKSP